MKTCENCENIHTGLYGSGRFCSTKCARGFSTKIRRREINAAVSLSIKEKLNIGKTVGYCKQKSSFRKCIICGKDSGRNKSCSKDCLKIIKRNNIKENKGMQGGYREGSGRGIKTWYISPIAGKVHLQSTWELEYAKYLDDNNIKWRRNTLKFEYIVDSSAHYYVPDFYLIDEEAYVEIKGFERPHDIHKWKNFPGTLKVLYKEDLVKLGINI